MSVLVTVVEGWTGALPFELQTDGSAFDYTGLTVQIVLKDCHGQTVVDTSSGLSSTGGTTGGQIAYAPSSGDFSASRTPYRVRFRVTDAQGKLVYFPNSSADLIEVTRA